MLRLWRNKLERNGISTCESGRNPCKKPFARPCQVTLSIIKQWWYEADSEQRSVIKQNLAIPELTLKNRWSQIGVELFHYTLSIYDTCVILRWLDRNKWRAVCLSKISNNFTISDSISLKLKINTHVNMSMWRLRVLHDVTFIEHTYLDKTAIYRKLGAKISFKLLQLAHYKILLWLSKFPKNRRNRNLDTIWSSKY